MGQIIDQLMVIAILAVGFGVLVGGIPKGKKVANWIWWHLVAQPATALLRGVNRQLWRGLNVSWRRLRPHLWRGISHIARRAWQSIANVARSIAGLIT